jgi:type I restriction enzyme, S subunit
MSSEWSAVEFRELFLAPLRNGLTRPKAVRGSGVKMINMGELFANERIGNLPMDRVPVTDKELSVNAVYPGDLLFARQSLVLSGAGKCSLFVDDKEPVVFESHLIRCRLDPAKADGGFYSYYFRSTSGRAKIESIVEQVSAAGIRGSDLAKLEVAHPPLTTQKAIAHILGTLDDKIELNRKTNETLEAIAKALFKSWFVDFDPVRAKAKGRPTGLPAEISDLFPDSFEDSELGEIPRGWECSLLADRAIYLSRGISPAYCEEGGVLILNQKCIRDSRVSFEKARLHDTTKKQIVGREVRRFDALVNSTGVGTLGRVAIMPICQEDVIVDSHVTVVRGSNEQESFFISSTLLNRQTEIEALGEGSTGQTELSRVVLGSVPVIFPSSQLISAFFDFAFTIQDKIEKNDQASISLASARDALLPKLISGEIRIPDAEKMLEEVGI